MSYFVCDVFMILLPSTNSIVLSVFFPALSSNPNNCVDVRAGKANYWKTIVNKCIESETSSTISNVLMRIFFMHHILKFHYIIPSLLIRHICIERFKTEINQCMSFGVLHLITWAVSCLRCGIFCWIFCVCCSLRRVVNERAKKMLPVHLICFVSHEILIDHFGGTDQFGNWWGNRIYNLKQ